MDVGDTRISLADVAGAGILLRASDAVAIVRELALQVVRGELAGIPSIAVIRLGSSGTVSVEGPVAADAQSVSRAAQLLEALVPNPDHEHRRIAGAQFRTPGGLRLLVARALGTLDLPPFNSLEEFAAALERFAPGSAAPVVRRLVAQVLDARREAESPELQESPEPPPPRPLIRTEPIVLEGDALTVSDIRRARRATGLTLSEVAERSRIPAWLLRELEWGYFANWPAGMYGRTQLVRYARAAGLDEKVIVRTLWPLLEEFAQERGSTIVAPGDVRPADPQSVEPGMMLIPLERSALVPVGAPAVVVPWRRRRRLAAMLAIAALLIVAMLPAIWQRSVDRQADEPPQTIADVPAAPAGRTSPPQTIADGPAVPAVRTSPPQPARAVAIPPVFTSEGTAVFDVDESGRNGSTLRITRVVDNDARNFHARVSPDGQLIAFDSDLEGERAVFVADANGRHLRRVSGDGFAAVPNWSPDGRTLVFSRAEADNPNVWNLWIVDLPTGELHRVTSNRTGQPVGASWFRDGQRIAYAVADRLVVRDLATEGERVFALKGRALGTPAVSPDGRRAVVHVADDGAWLVHLHDGSMQRVLSDPSAGDYAWSPDGRRLAYHSRRTGQWSVWVMAPRSGHVDP